jgi:hypothetical protein
VTWDGLKGGRVLENGEEENKIRHGVFLEKNRRS